GGASLPAETAALWQIWGVNLVEAYGQTETAGAFISAQPGPFARPGDVGTVVRGSEVKLAADGEILVRCPDHFDGYWQQPGATGGVVDAQAWLHTADVRQRSARRLPIVDPPPPLILPSSRQ